MSVTLLGWTRPFCGMALPAGCPWAHRPHRQPPPQAAWLLSLGVRLTETDRFGTSVI